jgi:hypothetical protein
VNWGVTVAGAGVGGGLLVANGGCCESKNDDDDELPLTPAASAEVTNAEVISDDPRLVLLARPRAKSAAVRAKPDGR